MRRLTRYGVIITAGLLASAACSSSSPSSTSTSTNGGTAGASGTLVIDNENGALWTCGFNPFNGSDTLVSVGFVYEPLVYVNPLQSGATTPMLATSWSWGAGNKSLVFNIRQGVKFTDGTPLTAADVAYTFNLIKKYPALDLTGVWSVLSSVTQTGPFQVTMNFSTEAVPWFYYIADQTPIVPMHIWSTIANPVAYPDSHPVGTGPYMVNPCTPSNITYTANPHFWQPGEPHIATLKYPAFLSNNTANDDLANGQAQWGAQYIPGIQQFYLSKSPDFHYWFPPVLNVSLVPNLTNPLLSNVKVRQAMAYAINRPQVSSIGESGYEPAANQAGIVTPTYSSWLDSSLMGQYANYTFDPAKAKQLLAEAGYHMGSNGIMVNSAGKQLAFTVINIGDYSDWVASMQVIVQDLKAVGIQLTPDNLTNTAFEADLYRGEYQIAYYEQATIGPSPYYELTDWLDSADTAPIGKLAATNMERYINPATDALIKSYGATTSVATQHSIIDQLEGVMLSDVPIIPITEGVDWYQYDTASFSGWPTQSDPYAQPPVWAYPDNEQVLLRLKPIGH
jgi:peptide/nickel transport system substrate-binding protein